MSTKMYVVCSYDSLEYSDLCYYPVAVCNTKEQATRVAEEREEESRKEAESLEESWHNYYTVFEVDYEN